MVVSTLLVLALVDGLAADFLVEMLALVVADLESFGVALTVITQTVTINILMNTKQDGG